MPQSVEHLIVEFISEVNICIKKPLQQTLRIKFTTFDVSSNFLVFGATSGGIYVFNRTKFEFLKLIPSKEGSIVKLLICPEEKYILIATVKGLIILVEHCFTDIAVRYQIFSEHAGNTITDLIWHLNDVYCADNKGKVSVISITSLLSKSIFQSPTATLMHLDSCICQLDACGKFLLVATKTKTFLCDTEAEQYRQIGKKLRDGDFGACFLSENQVLLSKNTEKERSRFKFIKEDESFPSGSTITGAPENVRIFCARPGYRIWEANFAGEVVCTYQFKSALQEDATEIICLDSETNSRLKTRKTFLNHFEHFGRLHTVYNKFIITYCKNNLVIFDKQGVKLLFVYEMRDIVSVRVVFNYIYVWNKKDVRIVALFDVESLLLKVLSARQYLLCSELCLKFMQSVLQRLKVNNSLRPLQILKDKCKPSDLKGLDSLFAAIEGLSKETSTLSQIVTVENGHLEKPSCSYTTSITIAPKPQKAKPVDPMQDPHYINNILYKQYQVNQLYTNIETAQLHELLSSKESLEDIVELFEMFITYVSSNGLENNSNVRCWCYSQFLKYVNNKRDSVRSLDVNSTALKTIYEALKMLSDKSQSNLCDCGFPLPLVETWEEYFPLAREVYLKLNIADRDPLLCKFPSLWKLRIDEIRDYLPLLMQLNSVVELKRRSEMFTYDNWNDCTLMLVKLKRGVCLNCDNKILAKGVMSWRDYGLIMLKRIGGLQTTKILKTYAKYIPNSELGYEFYQSCLFSAVSKENGKSCDFMAHVLTNSHLENQFEDGLKAYLNQKHLKKENSFVGDIHASENGVNCTICHLQINNAILDVNTRLSCGHVFHKLCLESVNSLCSLCVQASENGT